MEYIRIKKVKWEQIKKVALETSKLESGCRKQEIKQNELLYKFLQEKKLPTKIKIKIGKTYNIIYRESKNLGTRKYSCYITMYCGTKMSVTKETECYYQSDYMKIAKNRIIAIVEE